MCGMMEALRAIVYSSPLLKLSATELAAHQSNSLMFVRIYS
jgi:hypothetical protein